MKKHDVLLIGLLALVASCGNETTTGRRVELQTRLVPDLDATTHTVLTSMGWSVTLTRALVATGDLHFYDGPPAFTSNDRGRWRRLWAALSPVGTAHAHPGHYLPGGAKGEMLLPFSADLMAGPIDLPAGYGITGAVQSATFSFAVPSDGPAVDALGAHVALTQGSATKDGQTIHFVLAADLADVARTAKDGHVTGCKFDAVDIQEPGTVTVTVKPRVWLNFIDFSAVAPGTPEAPTVIAAPAVAHAAFAIGLAQLSAYEFSFSATP
jgi:hypothetical protein